MCGPKKQAKLINELRLAWKDQELGDPIMITLTVSWKRSGKYAHPKESWPQYVARMKAQGMEALGYELSQMTPKELRHWFYQFRQTWTKAYQKKFKERLSHYFACLEFTKQGAPHLHILIPKRFLTKPGAEQHLRDLWRRTTKGTGYGPKACYISWDGWSNNGHAVNTAERAMTYIAKYIGKELYKGEAKDLYRMRRYYISHWHRPMHSVEEATWYFSDDLETKDYPVRYCRRIYGKHYYYCVARPRERPHLPAEHFPTLPHTCTWRKEFCLAGLELRLEIDARAKVTNIRAECYKGQFISYLDMQHDMKRLAIEVATSDKLTPVISWDDHNYDRV